MLKHVLSVFAFMGVSFGVQGLNHFVINTEHYAGIDFARPDPIIPLGLLAMVIQGLILSFAVTKLAPAGATMRNGVTVSLAFGLFLASYIALAEPAKYAAPSIASWMVTEGIASTLQFVSFGFVLGFIHKKLG